MNEEDRQAPKVQPMTGRAWNYNAQVLTEAAKVIIQFPFETVEDQIRYTREVAFLLIPPDSRRQGEINIRAQEELMEILKPVRDQLKAWAGLDGEESK